MLEGVTYYMYSVYARAIAQSHFLTRRTTDTTAHSETNLFPFTATPLASSTINKRRGISTIISCWARHARKRGVWCQHEIANDPKSNGIECAPALSGILKKVTGRKVNK